MFRENLLESSKSAKRKRWPMAVAFTLEVIAASVLVMISLTTTGVIPVSAHVIACPLGSIRVAKPANQKNTSPSSRQPSYSVVNLADNRERTIVTSSDNNGSSNEPDLPDFRSLGPHGIPDLRVGGDRPVAVAKPAPHHWVVSNGSEAQLVNRVEPVYPRIAELTHRQGAVKLHAFISKEGRIDSLTVISGDPMFVNAAVGAVRQWRYRPYILNGEPVEVETFITVSFKGIRD